MSTQYIAMNDDRSEAWWEHPDQEGLWDENLSSVLQEAWIQREIGITNVRVVSRECTLTKGNT